MKITKSKTTATLISLFLMFAMTISLVAIPNASAQTLIMNLPGDEGAPHLVVIHSVVDIDLNGPSSFIENVTLWVKYPGRADFTYIGGYPTTTGGDLDVYDFDFNETGDFELKWALPPDFTIESQVEIARVVLEILRPSYAVISSTPNPVGTGQETLLTVGITQQLTMAPDGWEGLTVTVWRPDGTTETLGPIRTDSTGLTGYVYVPTMVGNYTLQTNFPKQKYQGITMEASTSEKYTLEVQEEPTPIWPGVPLPTEYWTRPIDAQLGEWSVIAGNWLEAYPRNWYAPYNDDAPETAHILWTRMLTQGGVVGGHLGNAYDEEALGYHSFEIGDAYEGKWGGGFGGGARLIIAGKLYYDKYAVPDVYQEVACVDLHTGEELWSRVLLDNRSVTFGQIMYWDTYDYHGVYDYLWVVRGRVWHAFDPVTGDWVYALTDIPQGTRVYGPKGEILLYNFNLNAGWMTMWNSTNIPDLYGSRSYASMSWGRWQPMGKTVSAVGPVTVRGQTPLGINGYQYNVSIPTDLPGSVRAVFPLDKAFGESHTQTHVYTWAIDLRPGREGQLLYSKTWNAPAKWLEGDLTISRGVYSSVDDLFTLRSKEDLVRYGFSMDTGDYKWTTEPLETLDHLMGGFAGESGAIAEGVFYSGTVSGTLKAFDVETGELLWKYEAKDPLNQVLWGNNWPICYLFFTDGKAYIATTEHSPVDPRPRGGPFICLNATTGEVIWRADGLFRQTVWGGRALIGDSIIATMDTYDQRVYGIGKGPSATTVAAAPKVSVHGSSVMVEGMVTDVSPGTEEYARTARFPNGVPVVSDANMSDWMLYVYKQFPRPTDVTGVEVVLEVLDPNNNFYEVERATSDSDGFFSCAFTPEVPGEYTIIATFAGSRAYYGSHAKTAINVEEAPAATPEPTPTPAPMTDTYVLGIGAGAIIAIIVIGMVIILMLRKR